MPRIPTYQERQTPGQSMGLGEVALPRADFGVIGRATQQLGSALGDIAKAQLRVEEEDAKAWAANTSADATLKWTSRMKEMQESIEPGARNFTSNVAKEFDPWADEVVKAAPNEQSRKFLQQSLLNLRQNVLSNAIAYEATEGRNHRFSLMENGITKAAQALYADPNEMTMQRIMGEQEALIDSLNDTPTRKAQLRDKLRLMIGRSGAEAMIRDNPQEFLNRLDTAKKEGRKDSGNPFLDLLNPTEWDTYIRSANTAIAQDRAIYREDMNRRMQDASAMAANGVRDPNPPGREAFVAAYGKDADRIYANYQSTQALATNIASMKSMPNEAIVATVQSLEPKPGPGYADALARQKVAEQAAKTLIQAREKDPAMAVITTSTRANSAYQNMARIMNDQQADPAAKSQAAQTFATTAIAEQQRLGIVNPRILTDSMRDNLARRISQGNETSADIVADLERTYGRQYFPMVMREMMQDNKLPPAMMIIPDLESFDSREVVSRVSASDKKALEAGVAEQERTAIKRRVTEHVATLRASAGPMSVQMASQLAAYEDTMYRVALERMGRGVDTSGAAAADAANTMLLGKYQFKGTLRIPKNMDAGNVTRGLNRSLSEQIVPSLTIADVPMDQTQARTPVEALTEWKSTVAARGIWISNNDTTTAQLWAQGKNGEFFRVMRGGKQIEVPFDEAIQTQQTIGGKTAREKRQAFREQRATESRNFNQMIGQ